MRYLGGVRGVGKLTHDGRTIARASYDFDEFATRPGLSTGTGEIKMTQRALESVFGRKDLKVLTDDGRSLSLRFADKRLRPASISAHVHVAYETPRPVSTPHRQTFGRRASGLASANRPLS